MDETLTVVPEVNTDELAEKVESLVEVLQTQLDQQEQEKLLLEEQQQLQAQEQTELDKQQQQELLLQQQQAQAEYDEELQFRQDLLASLEVLNENTVALVEQTEHSNMMDSELYPIAKVAFEWIVIAVCIAFLLWVVKQFEDMFNAAFRY